MRITELRTEGLWLPSLTGPPEWVTFLRRMSEHFDVPLDTSGVNYDLRHTLEQIRRNGTKVTLAGADMESAPDLGLRTLPFAPTVVFPWSVVWHTGSPRPAVTRLLDLLFRTSAAEGWCAVPASGAWSGAPSGHALTGSGGTTR